MRQILGAVYALGRFVVNLVLYPFGGNLPGRTRGTMFTGRRKSHTIDFTRPRKRGRRGRL